MSSYVLDYALSVEAVFCPQVADSRVTKRWGERAETHVTVERISQ